MATAKNKVAMGKNKDYVSFWFWMFALFVTALPCVGFIMAIVWAFAGDNESRKNYFRAIIAWCLILTAIWLGIMAVGLWPVILEKILTWWHQM